MKKFSKGAALPLSLFVMLGAGACRFKEKDIAAAELSKSYVRTTTENVAVTDTFQQSYTDFTFDFFQAASPSNGNMVISPLSAALCLALVNNGANGNTKTQLETMFGMDTDTLNKSLYAYTSTLYSAEDCRLDLANSIWMKENALNVNPDFLQTNADWYQAQAYAAPFDSTTVQDINNWCYNKTNGKFDSILSEIPPMAVMYLINAVDFDAKWQNKYEREDIENGVFYNHDGSESEATMLFSKERRYFMDEEAVGFTKAYMGGRYCFMALLPNEGVDVYTYAQSLNAERWKSLWENKKDDREVYARIPEFKHENELSLKDTLQALGVTDMFSPTDADFSGIDNTQQLYCDLIKQKAMIEVDRNGTKAAAVTMAGVNKMAMEPNEPLYITLNRPFVYAIVDYEYQLPIFLGVTSKI